MSKVTVTADKNGNIVKISENNPEFGFIRVEQIATQIANGWLRKVKRSAIINGNVNDLLDASFKDGQELALNAENTIGSCLQRHWVKEIVAAANFASV